MEYWTSQRLRWYQTPNQLYQIETSLREEHNELLDLRLSNPLHADLDLPIVDVLPSLFQKADYAHYSPHPRGLLLARESICRYYATRGIQLSPEQIILCASTSEAYSWLFKLLGDPYDFFMVPTPGYPLFDDLASLESVRLKRYPLIYSPFQQSWIIDRNRYQQLWIPSIRATLMVNPSNPLGSFVSREDYAFVSSYGIVIVDEVFVDYELESNPTYPSYAGETGGGVFILNGLSKLCGCPHLKLGWIILSGDPLFQKEMSTKLEWIADTYLSVSTPLQSILPDLMNFIDPVQKKVKERITSNLWRLKESKIPHFPVQAGWYAILQLPCEKSDEEWALYFLTQHHMLCYPGYFFDLPFSSCVVVSLLLPPSLWDYSLKIIAQSIA